VKEVDAARNTLTLTARRGGKDVDETFNLAKDVPVLIAGKTTELSGVKAGMAVSSMLVGGIHSMSKERS
jgi:hypothetical protein